MHIKCLYSLLALATLPIFSMKNKPKGSPILIEEGWTVLGHKKDLYKQIGLYKKKLLNQKKKLNESRKKVKDLEEENATLWSKLTTSNLKINQLLHIIQTYQIHDKPNFCSNILNWFSGYLTPENHLSPTTATPDNKKEEDILNDIV